MIRDILVLGGGSAGFVAAVTLKARRPGCRVRVIRSPDLGIIGVGEGTVPTFASHLHGYVGIDPGLFHREAAPTWKLGVRYTGWGPRPWWDYTFARQLDARYHVLPKQTGFYCPVDGAGRDGPDGPDGPSAAGAFDDVGLATGLMSRDKAFARAPDGRPVVTSGALYHVENERLVGFLDAYARRLGVAVTDATVADVRVDDRGVAGLALAGGGPVETADLYVDCSGFRSVLLGRALGEPFDGFRSSLFCDRAVVGGWDRGPDEPIRPYTAADAMAAGWAWRIDHEHRINRGYVYASDFIADDAAEREFRAANPRVGPTRVVRFVAGCYRRTWVKNVVAIGNANGFVEPLQATALAAACTASQNLAELIDDSDGDPPPTLRDLFNRRNAEDWQVLRRFLALHYKCNAGGPVSDTPFWRACRETTDLAGAEEALALYRENGPTTVWCSTVLNPRDQFGSEGYLAVLVGSGVPYDRRYAPSAQEQAAWAAVRQAVARKSAAGVGVADSLAAVRSAGWQWPRDLYR